MKKLRICKPDGTIHSEGALTPDALAAIHGMMVRCIMTDGTQHEGFVDSYRAHNKTVYDGTVHDAIDLWVWSNLDETTHRLVGHSATRFDQTWTSVSLSDIVHVDALLYSNPRWGGRLTNHFPEQIG